MRRRPATTAVSLTALVLAGLAVPITGTVARAAEPARTVTLVGSLQNELGCPADWQPECTVTDLTRVGDTKTYTRDFTVPKGSYALKVAINHSWAESYGQGGNDVPLVLGGPATLRFTYDDDTHAIGIAPVDLSGPTTAADSALATPSLRELATREHFYFVMTDRFANGDTANDRGGLTGDRLPTGFDPTDKGFYHGGDLDGRHAALDYIKGLGTTAIWLTPTFKNRPVQGTGADASAGYHGYWITDFTQIDPHLGTNAELEALIAEAHAKGIKVYFDIITNHTADVIDYEGGQHAYVSKATAPYKAADGDRLRRRAVAARRVRRHGAGRPRVLPGALGDPSFPYTPVFRSEADKTVKVPAWLNDPTLYHNRGDSTWAGESVTYGDFVGLDDLMTEPPTSSTGIDDVYKTGSTSASTASASTPPSTSTWSSGSSARQRARLRRTKVGKPDFFMFGEVYDADPAYSRQYARTGDLNAVLDFALPGRGAAASPRARPTTGVRDLFAGDDYYTTPTPTATALPTFLGNHDMGRVGHTPRQRLRRTTGQRGLPQRTSSRTS